MPWTATAAAVERIAGEKHVLAALSVSSFPRLVSLTGVFVRRGGGGGGGESDNTVGGVIGEVC